MGEVILKEHRDTEGIAQNIVYGVTLDEISNYTIQLFMPNNRLNYKSRGTGCLINYYGFPFLVSATHVFEGNDNDCLTDIPNCFIRMEDSSFVELDDGYQGISAQCDKVGNISFNVEPIVILLTEVSFKAILSCGKDFYPIEWFEANEAIESSQCICCGYPSKFYDSNIFRDNPIWDPRLFKSTIVTDPKPYLRNKWSIEDNMAISFIRKKMYDVAKNMYIMFPKPYGMSGGGMWQEYNGKYLLSGIMTDYKAETSMILTTKLGKCVDLMEEEIAKRGSSDNIYK